MDWWSNQRRRNRISKLAQEDSEFDLLVHRAKQRIILGQKIRGCFRLFERSPDSVKKGSWWINFTRNSGNL